MKQGNKRYKAFCYGCDRFQVGGGKKCPICHTRMPNKRLPSSKVEHRLCILGAGCSTPPSPNEWVEELEEAGLIGCFDGTGVNSENFRDVIYEEISKESIDN